MIELARVVARLEGGSALGKLLLRLSRVLFLRLLSKNNNTGLIGLIYTYQRTIGTIDNIEHAIVLQPVFVVIS